MPEREAHGLPMDSRERARLERAADAFRGASPFDGFERAHKPAHAALAWVYVLDDRYILRARDLDDGTAAAFHEERRLLARIGAGLVPWAVPRLLPTRDGTRFTVEGGLFWTLHEALPGRVLCPWQTLHRLDERAFEFLITALLRLHEMTRGRLSGGVPERFPTSVRSVLADTGSLLSADSRARVSLALERVERAARTFEESQLCFVHGDFHYGNLLLDESDEITGLIDLDWCRIGHPFEDLAYTTMMLLRDYRTGEQRLDLLEPVQRWYGVTDDTRALLREYLLLYALYDVQVFQQAINLARRDFYLETQLALLETLAAEFATGAAGISCSRRRPWGI